MLAPSPLIWQALLDEAFATFARSILRDESDTPEVIDDQQSDIVDLRNAIQSGLQRVSSALEITHGDTLGNCLHDGFEDAFFGPLADRRQELEDEEPFGDPNEEHRLCKAQMGLSR